MIEEKQNVDQLSYLIEQQLPLNRHNASPLWQQVKELLLTAIAHSSVEHDTRLPSEQSLCEQLGVSRPIVRMALDGLVASGMVTKVARQGNFVSKSRQEVDFASQNSGLFGEISKGHLVTTRILHIERGTPTKHEKEMLLLPPPADVFRIRRVYFVDGKATSVSMLRIAGHRVPGIEKWIQDNVSVYGTMRDRFGLRIAHSERWFEATMPTREEAELLNIPLLQPLIGIESVGRTQDGTPLEYYQTVFNTATSRIKVIANT
ncbi:GntR family transcriptional regulator [Serratia rhizosphaerae]|uniref:GntR family transcriptional regulator n=1 Tax=Serratia rhizosphaerae TaxID=2597702 RepID=A0ABX6GP45_9GAMM|nr:GntR family transcriptional regulator [Serratia rhizosphaerae]QHA88051.1 GntR family transcriptional regulator [Serratia rhizosphaerae]